MKKIIFVAMLLFAAVGFSQEGVNISKNTLTTKELPPVWPGCEETTKTKKACFQEKLAQHLKTHYNYPKDATGNIIRGRSIVSFIINEEGKPEISKVEGENPALNKEAKRIILAIPKMTPGQLAGKPTAIRYKVPFTF